MLRSLVGSEMCIRDRTYYRAGYMPEHYDAKSAWNGRRVLELSRSIQAPSIAYQLMGCKKVQQTLALPGVVERFLDPFEAQMLRSSLVGHYSMAPGETSADLFQKIRDCPGDYVLKPQREGGGNNIYGDDVQAAVESLTPDELGSYILMDIIQTESSCTHMVKGGKLISDVMIKSELGIYGVLVRRDDQYIVNHAVGWLLRSKTASSNETGINAGYGMLDGIELV
eukprot:TRINITY_DN49011_c0_g1_i1.p1 TRINITY_DN49011_c0_g1~~TRINITY_DN49011_c0_g1_i1.p1  ORF type:complete len:225 (-),score=55.71 TRINITY_DN49011_c0_g1_i1:16-690(-)